MIEFKLFDMALCPRIIALTLVACKLFQMLGPKYLPRPRKLTFRAFLYFPGFAVGHSTISLTLFLAWVS